MILRVVPKPLAALLLCVAICGVTWALIVPAWGGPDEDAHFSYSQTLAELGRLPGGAGESVTDEQRQLMDFTNTDATTFFRYAKPDWSQVLDDRWRKATKSANRKNGGGGGAAADYPPAYYMVEALAYEAAGGSDIATRLYAMRLLSVVWLLVAATSAWLLAGEVFGRRRPLQLVTGAAVGLWPMMCFVTGIMNPDAMFIGLSALCTWLGVSVIRGSGGPARVIALCLCVGVALVTKATALALLPPLVLALVVAAWHGRRSASVRHVAVALVAAIAIAVPVGAWIITAHNDGRSAYGQTALVTAPTAAPTAAGSAADAASGKGSLRHFASYLWQFYLPKLPSQDPIRFIFPVISQYPAFEVWVASGWASFGWVNVWFPKWTYYLFLGVILLAVAGLVAVGVRALRRFRRRRAVPGERRARPRGVFAAPLFMALFAGTLLLGLHRTDFRMFLDDGAPFLQGRYILPIAPLFALLLAQSTRAVPRRFRPAVQSGVLAALVVFQLACLGLVAWRYYAG